MKTIKMKGFCVKCGRSYNELPSASKNETDDGLCPSCHADTLFSLFMTQSPSKKAKTK